MLCYMISHYHFCLARELGDRNLSLLFSLLEYVSAYGGRLFLGGCNLIVWFEIILKDFGKGMTMKFIGKGP